MSELSTEFRNHMHMISVLETVNSFRYAKVTNALSKDVPAPVIDAICLERSKTNERVMQHISASATLNDRDDATMLSELYIAELGCVANCNSCLTLLDESSEDKDVQMFIAFVTQIRDSHMALLKVLMPYRPVDAPKE